MIFNYIKYLKPIWYYNLKPLNDYSYFPSEDQLQKEGFSMKRDLKYKSVTAQRHDLSWAAFQSGFITMDKGNGIDVWLNYDIPAVDEYRFLRKNFHSAWVLYVLLIRILTFHNPFKELNAYFKAADVQRVDYSNTVHSSVAYQNFHNDLIASKPLVSVIIPTLNRYEYLAAVFKDFEQQTYTNFELIVVDQTDDFKADFYKGWNLTITFWYQEEKALWNARNEAIKAAKGEFILMSEDDIRVPKDLIENHLKALDFFKADVSCGVFFPEGGSIPKERNFFKYGEQFATGNALLRRQLFKEVGLYDRQFEKQRMGDGEFGLRLYINGYKLISNPLAYCIDVKAPEGGLRVAGGSWDAWRPKKWNHPRPVPSVLYFTRKYFGNKLAILFIIPSVAPSIIPYQFKRNKALKFLSLFLMPFLLPLLVYQVYKSWNLASEKLKQGALIEFL